MIDPDPSNPDGLLVVVDSEYQLNTELGRYGLTDNADSFIVSGISDVSGGKVIILKKYGSFEKEATEYQGRLG